LTILVISGEEHNLWTSSMCNFHHPLTPSTPRSLHPSQHPVLKHHQSVLSLTWDEVYCIPRPSSTGSLCLGAVKPRLYPKLEDHHASADRDSQYSQPSLHSKWVCTMQWWQETKRNCNIKYYID
jgi:hypothetical protein